MPLADARPGFNLCTQLLQRETHYQRNSWHYQSSIYRQRLRIAVNLYSKDLIGHYGCVNALEFSNGGEYLASGGDDKRVLIWHVEKAASNIGGPRSLNGEHSSNIFCLGFDSRNRKVFSGGNDELVLGHDFETGRTLYVFPHDNPVYGLSVDKTSDNLVSTATEDGQILVYDLRAANADPLEVACFRSPFNAVEFHPLNGNYLVSANSKRGAMLWDIRCVVQPVMQYNYISETPSCMSVRFNTNGSLILALHRRLPPILFRTNAKEPVCTFFHHEYFNSCTMKSCTFAGPDDELVMSGSDDFNLYGWRLNDVDMDRKDQWLDSAQMVLYGHRSIVNQVRYNRQRCMIASSGVEKLIKLWSPFEQKDWKGDLLSRPLYPPKTRELYSPTPMSEMSQDFSTRNTSEDPQMMAFFDSLVQRELDCWETQSSQYSGRSRTDSLTTSSSSTGISSEAINERSPNRTAAARPNNEQERAQSDTESWEAYPNRISYLIAKKHHALLCLAIKSSTSRGNLPRRVVCKAPVARLMDASTPQSTSYNLYSNPARIRSWLADYEAHVNTYGPATTDEEEDDESPTTSAAATPRNTNAYVLRDSYHGGTSSTSSASSGSDTSSQMECCSSDDGGARTTVFAASVVSNTEIVANPTAAIATSSTANGNSNANSSNANEQQSSQACKRKICDWPYKAKRTKGAPGTRCLPQHTSSSSSLSSSSSSSSSSCDEDADNNRHAKNTVVNNNNNNRGKGEADSSRNSSTTPNNNNNSSSRRNGRNSSYYGKGILINSIIVVSSSSSEDEPDSTTVEHDESPTSSRLARNGQPQPQRQLIPSPPPPPPVISKSNNNHTNNNSSSAANHNNNNNRVFGTKHHPQSQQQQKRKY